MWVVLANDHLKGTIFISSSTNCLIVFEVHNVTVAKTIIQRNLFFASFFFREQLSLAYITAGKTISFICCNLCLNWFYISFSLNKIFKLFSIIVSWYILTTTFKMLQMDSNVLSKGLWSISFHLLKDTIIFYFTIFTVNCSSKDHYGIYIFLSFFFPLSLSLLLNCQGGLPI